MNASPTSVAIDVIGNYLNIPVVDEGADSVRLELLVDGEIARAFTVALASIEPDYWVHLDLKPFSGRQATVRVSDGRRHPGLKLVHQSAEPEHLEELYREPLRPQVHFSSRRGWINDPNGLVYHKGEYHLFFQHNPYSTHWGDIHWGHAVSNDLIHWKQLDEALYPDGAGMAFSGSCVVDSMSSSGFGGGSSPPLVAVFTSAFSPTPEEKNRGMKWMERQSVAYSNDLGRTWTKYRNNPVIGDLSSQLGTYNARDPYVFRHEESARWVMVMFQRLELVILTSENLTDWTERSRFGTFWECPCMFPLAVDGNPDDIRWVVHGGAGDYLIGTFDGAVFEAKSGVHNYARGYLYAAQSFNIMTQADPRRVQIGWAQLPAAGMPFSGMMGVPTELTLRTTADGVRLFSEPVRELAALNGRGENGNDLSPEEARGLLHPLNTECLRLVLCVENRTAMSWGIRIGEDTILYSLRDNAFFFNHEKDHLQEKLAQLRYLPELGRRRMRLEIILDRISIEVFVDDGRFCFVLPRTIPSRRRSARPSYGSISMFTDPDGEIRITSIDAHELEPIWTVSADGPERSVGAGL